MRQVPPVDEAKLRSALKARLKQHRRHSQSERFRNLRAALKAFREADKNHESIAAKCLPATNMAAVQAAATRRALLSYPDLELGKWHLWTRDDQPPPVDIPEPLVSELKRVEQNLYEALFGVVRVEKRALGRPYVLDVIADRQNAGDLEFFEKLGDAAKTSIGRHKRSQVDMALMSRALHDIGLRGDTLLDELYKRLPEAQPEPDNERTADALRKLWERHGLT